MTTLRLEEPTPARKDEALGYLEEHVSCASPINGCGSLDKCLDGWTYEQWLAELGRRRDPAYARSIGRAPSRTFFLVRTDDDRIVGMINLRYQLEKADIASGMSHIGYGIRPAERRQGYNKANLYLGLLEERRLGEEHVLLACADSNVASNRTVLALGGKLERSEVDARDGELTNYYWIDVEDSLERYAGTYLPLIDFR